MMTTLTNSSDVFLLFFIQWSSNLLCQALRQTQDGVERRTQFVAHVSKKLILDPQSTRQVGVCPAEVGCTFLHALHQLVAFGLQGDFHLFTLGDIPGVVCQAGSHIQIVLSVVLPFVRYANHSLQLFTTDSGNDELAQDWLASWRLACNRR